MPNDIVILRYWVRDTEEYGQWIEKLIPRSDAEYIIDNHIYDRAEMKSPPPGAIDF